MSKDIYTLRNMTRPEVDFALREAGREGWNPGLEDAECFYRADPQGFFIGLLDGQPIGCISGVSYEGKFGFIGLYIILNEYRGKGYGMQIWHAALEHLEGQNIGLDSVPEQVPNYVRSGFHPAYTNFRFEGFPAGLPPPDARIVNISKVPFETVRNYDRRCFPADRTAFLEGWLKMPGSTALGCLENGRLKGYGVIRRCGKGYKIGPLFADNADVADNLYRGLTAKIGQRTPVYFDVVQPNRSALAMAEKYHMKESFSTVRLYSQEQPKIDLARVFGVTTFELG
jgi:GNAT superfamily N-acetyltransferase